MDIMSDNTHLSMFAKCVRELNPSTDNPCFSPTIQVAIKDGKETETYTEKLAKAMGVINEHGNHPVLSQCVFVPFGRGAAIGQNTFCSLIRMQNDFYTTSNKSQFMDCLTSTLNFTLGMTVTMAMIMQTPLENYYWMNYIDGQHIFHSIERTMKADTTRALFPKQNEIICNTILSNLDTWLGATFIDANSNVSFRNSAEVRISTSTIDQRKNQNQVKFNAYASRSAKIFCSENPNQAIEF
jgi:hypothetical protein